MGLKRAVRRFNKKYLNPVAHVTLYPVFGLGLGLFMRLWSMSIRTEVLNREARPDLDIIKAGRTVIYAFWHGRQFLLFHLLKPSRCTVMTSKSEAGEIQTWVLRSFGHSVVRGSNTRGAVSALVQMIRRLKSGRNGAFAVDGPRGPACIVKPGVIHSAMKAGAEIIPLSVAFRKKRVLENLWDRYHLPRPFTRAFIKFGEPLTCPRTMEPEQVDAMRETLGDILQELTEETDRAAEGDFNGKQKKLEN
jgi:hypothetical protein